MHEHVCMYVYAMCNNHRKFEIRSMKRSEEVFFIVNPFHHLCCSLAVRHRFQQRHDEDRGGHVARIPESLPTEDSLYVRVPGAGQGTSPIGIPRPQLVSYVQRGQRVSLSLSVCRPSLSLLWLRAYKWITRERERGEEDRLIDGWKLLKNCYAYR